MLNQETYLSYKNVINDYLGHVITRSPYEATSLQNAIQYSVLNGGKRLRPLLIYTLAKSLTDTEFERYESNVLKLAASCELVHAYSLVHDDLPAMDNDDWRRGKLACHKQFDEATAILVGDALQSLAFFVLSMPFVSIETSDQLRLINLFAKAIGQLGMVDGQALDLQQHATSLEALTTMHRLKTGALFDVAIEATLISINYKNDNNTTLLKKLSYHLGLGFQIQDDILDVEATSNTLGKPQLSDQEQGKCTFVTVLGLSEAKKQLQQHHNSVTSILTDLSLEGSIFANLIKDIQRRLN